MNLAAHGVRCLRVQLQIRAGVTMKEHNERNLDQYVGSAKNSFLSLDEFYTRVPAMMHSIDSKGCLNYVSDGWLSALGFERHEVIGQHYSRFMTDASRRYAEESVLPEFFRRGRCDNIEYTLVGKDGKTIDILLSSTLQRDGSGKPLRSLAVILDITDRNRLDHALVESERRYRALFDHMQAGFALLQLKEASAEGQEDSTLDFVAVNPAFAELCGINREAVIGQSFHQALSSLLHAVPTCTAALKEVALTGERKELSDLGGPRGRSFNLVIYSPGINQCGLLIQETTQRKRMQETLRKQHEQILVTLHSIGDAVIATDNAGRIQYLNPVSERLTGSTLEQMRGQLLETVFQIFDERTGIPASNPVECCLSENRGIRLNGGVVLVSEDGAHFSIEGSASPITDADGAISGVVLVFRDITDQRRIENELVYRATHDHLTGLLNRAEFEIHVLAALEDLRRAANPGALLYVDLDQFKLVNDTCGHAAGDALLKRVSSHLLAQFPLPHTLARFGGDEFGIIVKDCSIDQARTIASALCRQIDELRFEYKGYNLSVGASIGVVPLDHNWESVSEVMQCVDSACYAAKDAGRNRVHVCSQTDQAMLARRDEMSWVRRLRHAIDEDRFVLFAQEMCALQAPTAGLHFEVLLRLRDENDALILPAAFLPAAERFNIASRIDRWVVHHVFRWMSHHSKQFDQLECVSVNLSGQSISDSAFHDYIAALLHTFLLDGRKLCFEVTETAAVTNLNAAVAFVDMLKQYGVRFALDDFGSGASSFGYLKALQVDYLKIDGQFVKNMAHDALDRTVVRCIQEVATVLGKETIAEFVESELEVALLKRMGVTHAQGFFYHRPQPMDHILNYRRRL